MTITFTEEEWTRHVSAIDQWRFERESLMERILHEELSDSKVLEKVFQRYRDEKKFQQFHLQSPIPRTTLNVSH